MRPGRRKRGGLIQYWPHERQEGRAGRPRAGGKWPPLRPEPLKQALLLRQVARRERLAHLLIDGLTAPAAAPRWLRLAGRSCYRMTFTHARQRDLPPS